jgi:release factor glutamine methyltransferase
MNIDRSELIAYADIQVNAGVADKYSEYIERRSKREPLQYILGTQEFMGIEFAVNPSVFIPRPESELLVWASAEAAKSHIKHHVLDLCTGSGAIGLAIARRLENAVVTCTDISEAAVKTARANARRLGLMDRAEVLTGDLFEPVKGRRFDIIACNPPYIPDAQIPLLQPEVYKYEPVTALSGGADGLDFYRRILSSVEGYLNEGGCLIFEVGANQAENVADMMGALFGQIETIADDNGMERVLTGKLKVDLCEKT